MASVLAFATLFFSSLALAQFSQQGPKLIGTFAVGTSDQGYSVALSADGSTAIVGGPNDNESVPYDGGPGAAWVYTLSGGGVWTQQGSKLVGIGMVGNAALGQSVALSADGNTAIVGGWSDNFGTGAAWVYTRNGGVWTQQGSKLVGTGVTGDNGGGQGGSVALSADGNTAMVGGPLDGTGAGAAWVYTRSGGTWTQQGSKLVGTGAVALANQGISVALSADGNTAIVGGASDNSNGLTGAVGAVWVYTRSGGAWTQQGSKLIGTGAIGGAGQGISVAPSADGNTLLVGGYGDNSGVGAVWVFTRSNGVWTQQGSKLVGTGAAAGLVEQGSSVALSADGNTAMVGARIDNADAGAAWAFTRSGGVWTQLGSKLVGTGAVGAAEQGTSVALSGDGYTAMVGGAQDNLGSGDATGVGAAWMFTQPKLQVTPSSNITTAGTHGGPFSLSSFTYMLSASKDSVSYAITTSSWLTASSTSGTVTTSPASITFTVNSSARKLVPNIYAGNISFSNTISGAGNTSRAATLTVNPKDYKLTVHASPSSDGTVTGGGEVPEGGQTTVTATPDTGFNFVQWTENGHRVSTASSYTFTMSSKAVTVVAHFQKN